MNNTARAFLFCLGVLLVAPAGAQDQALTNMEIFRQKVKADKKLVVAANMQLNDAEAKGFWPVYDAYQSELAGLNDRTMKLIVAYAEAYKKGSVPDATARKLLAEQIAIEDAEVKLKQSFVPRLGKVIPDMKVARYMQVENKIRAAIKYELAGAIPLVD